MDHPTIRPSDRPTVRLSEHLSRNMFHAPCWIIVADKLVSCGSVIGVCHDRFSKTVFFLIGFSKPIFIQNQFGLNRSFPKSVFPNRFFLPKSAKIRPVLGKPVFGQPVFGKPVFGKPILEINHSTENVSARVAPIRNIRFQAGMTPDRKLWIGPIWALTLTWTLFVINFSNSKKLLLPRIFCICTAHCFSPLLA